MRSFLVVAGVLAAVSSCGGDNISLSNDNIADDSRLSDLTVAGQYLYVRVPRTMLDKEFYAATEFNPDHIKDSEFVFGYIKKNSLENLPTESISQLKLLDSKNWARFKHDPKTLERIESSFDQETGRESYHNYEALTAEIKNLADAFPSLMTVYSAGKSVQGRELWYARISATPPGADTATAGPKLLYIANMHGDETVGRELALYLIRQLVRDYETSPRVNNLVKNSQIFIMPSMNPDGFELGQRYNKNGVDLNRNFPDFTSDPNDTGAGRAIETKHIMALHDLHNFDLAVNYHGGEVCFNLPWDTKTNRTAADRFGDDPLLTALGREYADANSTMKLRNGGSFTNGLTYGYEWYEVNGGMQDWAAFYRQSAHSTVELSYTKYPAASFLETAWRENQESMIGFLERGLRGIHLKVVDALGQPVNGASVSVSSATRTVKYKDANISRVTLAGDQRVTVEAPGLQATVVQLQAAPFNGTYHEVILPSP